MTRWNRNYFYWLFLFCWLPHAWEMPLWSTATVLGVALLSFVADRSYLRHLQQREIALATIATVLYVWSQHRTLLGPEPATQLFLVLAALKLHELRQHRDALIFLFICIVLILFALLFQQNLLMTLYMVIMTIAVTVAGLALHTPSPRLSTVLKSSPKLVSMDLLLCLPIFIIFFVFFPRFQMPWAQISNNTKNQIGFNSEFNPGEMAELAQSEEIAFRVSFDGQTQPQPQDLYWRGLVLTSTDGWRWRERQGLVTYDSDSSGQQVRTNNPVNYTLTLEPRFDKFLFALDHPLGLNMPSPLDRNTIQRKTNSTFANRFSVFQKFIYRGQSLLGGVYPISPPATVLEENTIVRSKPSAQVQNLIQPWMQLSANEKAQKILDYFSTQGFQYSLSTPEMKSVDDFLFKSKIGFCEHYAGAFSYLMRAMQVPARVILGFQGGERNEYSDYWIVRDKNAHAWSEIWLQGSGWQRVDPTQAVNSYRIQFGQLEPSGGESSNLLVKTWYKTALFWDALNARYTDFLLNYNFSAQSEMLQFENFKLKRWHLLILVSLTTLLILLLLHKFLKTHSPTPMQRVDQIYQPLFQALARQGWPRDKSEGVESYYDRIFSKNPDLASALRPTLAELAHQKYGKSDLTEDKANDLRNSVQKTLKTISLHYRPKDGDKPLL